EPRDVVTVGAVDEGEVAGDQKLPVRLQGHGPDCSVGSQTGIEAGIKVAVRHEPGDSVTVGAIERGEVAADVNFAVWRKRQAGDHSVCSRIRRSHKRKVR